MAVGNISIILNLSATRIKVEVSSVFCFRALSLHSCTETDSDNDCKALGYCTSEGAVHKFDKMLKRVLRYRDNCSEILTRYHIYMSGKRGGIGDLFIT